MTTNICKTPNFLWKTNQFLGEGASGKVYEGLHRKTGQRVAVKTSNRILQQTKEFEMLTKIDHKNVIRLLGQEIEETSEMPVIIMELCSGGSLRDVLDLPENAYGLEEKEFLLFLKHLNAGMKYLREINIIHRDIKPGNILCFLGENGKSIYKLSDFDTARELQDDEKFNTICGTLGYIHPVMYNLYLTREEHNLNIPATVDLWSIGITIYHTITGELPFRSTGIQIGEFYLLISKKEYGVISGIQHTENDPIKWSSELPATTRLSRGLKDLVTPILAGLLELDQKKNLKFDSFFKEVTNILCKVKFHIFCLHLSSFLIIYIDSHEHFKKFQDLIAEQTGIEPLNQCILFNSRVFEVEALMVVSEYPKTKFDKPFILLCKSFLPSINVIPAFHNLDSQHYFKCNLSIAFYYKRKVEEICTSQLLIHETVKGLRDTLHKKTDQSNKSLGQLLEKWNFLSKFLTLWNSNSSSFHNIFDLFLPYVQGLKGYKNKLKSSLEDKRNKHDLLSKSLSTLEKKLNEATIKAKSQSITSWNFSISCLHEKNCNEYLTTLIKDMNDVYQHYEERLKNNYEKSELDTLEETRFQDNISKINDRLHKHCLYNNLEVHNKFHKWYADNDGPHFLFSEVKNLINEIALIHDEINSFTELVQKDWQEYEVILNELSTSIGHEGLSSNTSFSNVIKESSKKLNKAVQGKFRHNLKKLAEMLANSWKIMREDENVLKELSSITISDA